jgi:hypothetical protein
LANSKNAKFSIENRRDWGVGVGVKSMGDGMQRQVFMTVTEKEERLMDQLLIQITNNAVCVCVCVCVCMCV